MSTSSTDKIEKSIELKAPQSRVWRAITDHNEFGEWFGVTLEGPFAAGQVTGGRIHYPGYEHLKWQVTVETIEPESLFSFRWHPYAIEPDVDYSGEPTTLIEFKLQPIEDGTLLTIIESGFDAIPAARRDEAFRMDSYGWDEQIKNIAAYVQPKS